MLSIGELSRRSEVKVPTIRYYEQIGLLDEPERSEGNQRRYERADLERLTFIRHARDLGFDIEAIRELVELGAHPEKPCAGADRIAGDHLAAVRDRIARLQQLERELTRIVRLCTAAGPAGECRVLEALSDHDGCTEPH